MERTAATLKALSDPTRLRIVSLLRHGAMCVCDLVEALRTPQSKISRHLAFLKNAGWVVAERSGKWMHYSLAEDESSLHKRVLEVLKTELPLNNVCADDDQRYFLYRDSKPSQSCD
jgi:ArsR family transcriptional regulator